jgi:integrase
MDQQSSAGRAGPRDLANAARGNGTSTPAVRTARLQQNPRGLWEIAYSEPVSTGGWRSRRISTRTTDRVAAEQELNRFLRNEVKLTQQAAVDHHTVEQLCAFYITNHASKKSESAWMSLKYIRALLGHMAPLDLTPQVVNAYRRQREVKDGTVRRELGALTAALNYCQGHNLITMKPKLDLPPTSPPRVLFMTEAQEEIFWNAAMAWGDRPGQRGGPVDGAGRRIKLFVALALETAARAEAIMQLTWDRVDFQHMLIDYRVPGASTSKKRRAVVPISDRLLPVLQWGAENQHPQAKVVGVGDIKKGWKTFVNSVGLPWVTPHVCRHTWATQAAHDGVSLLKIAQLLGDTVETVERNYIHFQPDRLRDVVNRRKTVFSPVSVAA